MLIRFDSDRLPVESLDWTAAPDHRLTTTSRVSWRRGHLDTQHTDS